MRKLRNLFVMAKNVNGGVEKQNKDSNLSKQPEKTKDFCSEGEKKSSNK